jgi:hypothetical protein
MANATAFFETSFANPCRRLLAFLFSLLSPSS